MSISTATAPNRVAADETLCTWLGPEKRCHTCGASSSDMCSICGICNKDVSRDHHGAGVGEAKLGHEEIEFVEEDSRGESDDASDVEHFISGLLSGGMHEHIPS